MRIAWGSNKLDASADSIMHETVAAIIEVDMGYLNGQKGYEDVQSSRTMKESIASGLTQGR